MERRRCDHDRRNPRLTPIAALRSTHDLIAEARSRVQLLHARRFESDLTEPLRRRQKGRRGHPGRGVVQVGSLYSQRAEAQTLVLLRLLDGCNVRTLECGRHDQAGRLEARWTVEDLIRDTGLSVDRVERALSDLAAGREGERLVFRLQGREKEGAKWIGLTAITKLTRALFEWLDLGGRRDHLLGKERQAERKVERKAERKAQRAAAPPPPPEYWALTFELGNAHPDWPEERVRAEALALARGRPPPPGSEPPAS